MSEPTERIGVSETRNRFLEIVRDFEAGRRSMVIVTSGRLPVVAVVPVNGDGEIIAANRTTEEPDPVESAVPGRLVREWHDSGEWPTDYCWQEDALFSDGPTDEYPQNAGVDEDAVYDFTDWELDYEGIGDLRDPMSLWDAFLIWHRRAYMINPDIPLAMAEIHIPPPDPPRPRSVRVAFTVAEWAALKRCSRVGNENVNKTSRVLLLAALNAVVGLEPEESRVLPPPEVLELEIRDREGKSDGSAA